MPSASLAERLRGVLVVVAGTQAEAHLIQCLPAAPSPNLPPSRHDRRVILAVLDPSDPPPQGLLASRIVESAAGVRGTELVLLVGGALGGLPRGRRRVRGEARRPQAGPAGRGGRPRRPPRSPRHPLHRPRGRRHGRPGEPLSEEEDIGPRGDRLPGKARRAFRRPAGTGPRGAGAGRRPARGAARRRALAGSRAGARRGAIQDRGRGRGGRAGRQNERASAPRGGYGRRPSWTRT